MDVVGSAKYPAESEVYPRKRMEHRYARKQRAPYATTLPKRMSSSSAGIYGHPRGRSDEQWEGDTTLCRE